MISMLFVDKQSGILPMSLLSYTLQPGQFGEIWSEPVVAVGAVGWECSPGEPLDETMDGESCVESFQGKEEVDETGSS
jgi:hypothetical protein